MQETAVSLTDEELGLASRSARFFINSPLSLTVHRHDADGAAWPGDDAPRQEDPNIRAYGGYLCPVCGCIRRTGGQSCV